MDDDLRAHVARAVDPDAFEDWRDLYDHIVSGGESEERAQRVADRFHKGACDAALAKAGEILALPALAAKDARIAELEEALELSRSALQEAEAILGGEYGDHYANLCQQMMDLDDRLATLHSQGEGR